MQSKRELNAILHQGKSLDVNSFNSQNIISFLMIFIIVTFSSSCNTQKKLCGTWEMKMPPNENAAIQLRITKEQYTFFVNGDKTVQHNYTFQESTIISEVKPIINLRDSLRVVTVNRDTLVIELKEMGRYIPRTFVKVK
jgi:hypothetical protein